MKSYWLLISILVLAAKSFAQDICVTLPAAASSTKSFASSLVGYLNKKEEALPLSRKFSAYKSGARSKVLDLREKKLNHFVGAGIFELEKCKQMQDYARSVVGRIVEKSNLQGEAMAEPQLKVVVRCANFSKTPDAHAAAGILEILPGTFLLAETEDEFAAVISHELAHHFLRHDAEVAQKFPNPKAMSSDDVFSAPSLPKDFLALKRKHEVEADINGAKLMVQAGYNPKAALVMLNKMQAATGKMISEGMHSTHPELADREAAVRSACGDISKYQMSTAVPPQIKDAVKSYFKWTEAPRKTSDAPIVFPKDLGFYN